MKTRLASIILLLGVVFGTLTPLSRAQQPQLAIVEGERRVERCAVPGAQMVARLIDAAALALECVSPPATPTAEPTATPFPTATVAPSVTPLPTSTPTSSPTSVPTATVLPTLTPTMTPTAPAELGRPTVNLVYFWRPGVDGMAQVQDIARRAKVIALQKEDLPYVKALRGAGFKGPILQYFLTSEAQNPAGIAWAPWGNNWFYKSGDWAAATDDMFLRKADGSRFCSGSNGMCYLDLGAQKSLDLILSRVKESAAHGFDGIILDNLRLRNDLLEKRAGGQIYNGQRQPYSEVQLLKDEAELLRLIDQALGSRLLGANLIDDPRNGSSWNQFLPYLDWTLDEAFATGWPLHGYPLSTTEYLNTLKQAETVLAQGKGFIGVGQGSQTSSMLPVFHQASWMLITDGSDRAAMRYSQADAGYGRWWLYPSYNLDCGAPTGPRYAVGTLQQRKFERCLVTVDPAKRTGTIQVMTP